MTGTVMEWLRDSTDKHGIGRYFTGGDWAGESDYMRADYRGDNGPDNRFSFIGFRCVAQPEDSSK